MSKYVLPAVCVLLFGFVGELGAATAPTLEAGYEADATFTAGVRFKSFANTGDRELYVGAPTVDTAGRSEIDIRWAASNAITISYNGAAVTATIVNANGTYELSHAAAAAGTENYLQLDVVNRDDGDPLSFLDVELDGHGLGDFTASGWNTYNVSGYCLADGFELTGTVALTGPFGTSAELSKINVLIGTNPHDVLPEPATMGLLALGAAPQLIRRRKR